MPDKPFDIHCKNCKQVIVPADKMRDLAGWKDGSFDGLLVPFVTPMVIISADFLCPNCGRMVYFRLNEQKLDRLLKRIKG